MQQSFTLLAKMTENRSQTSPQGEALCERMRLGGFEMGVGFKGRLLLIPPLSGMDASMRERLFRTLEESLQALGHGAGA